MLFKAVDPNPRALGPSLLAGVQKQVYAELGVKHGDTLLAVAEAMPAGWLHAFDFADTLETVRKRVEDIPELYNKHTWVWHPNSRQTMDSYCWTLGRMIAERVNPGFTYVFLDGAHTYETDALAFFLLDRLIRPGAFIEFDDYNWSVQRSDAYRANPVGYNAGWTAEQRAVPAVAMIVDTLVKGSGRYVETYKTRLFCKAND